MYTEPAWIMSAPSLQSTCDMLKGKMKSARDRLEGLQQESAHNNCQHKALGAAIAGYLGLDSIFIDEAAVALAAIRQVCACCNKTLNRKQIVHV